MKNKRRFAFWILLCVVILMVGLVGCGTPVPPTTPPPVPPTETPGAASRQIAELSFNQIILMGTESDLEKAVGAYNDAHPNQPLGQPIAEIALEYLQGIGPAEVNPPESLSADKTSVTEKPLFSSNQYASLRMQLYENPEEISTLIDHVNEINTRRTTGEAPGVYADANLITDPLDSDSCGEPYSGGGSPYSGGGSPYSGGGSGLPSLGTDVESADFETQWAFQAATGGIALAGNPVSGAGISVGVFDTAPWNAADPTSWTAVATSPWIDTSHILSLPDGTSLNVTVRDSINEFSRSATTSAISTADIKDHGWFATGLVAASAPDVQVSLFRVLDDNGCGDLFTVSAAIHQFLQEKSAGIGNGLMDRVVINLSLGVHVPDNIYYRIDTGKQLPREIASLQTAVYEAYRLGAVIVAASGNDSAPPTGASSFDAQKMQLPAYYNVVIGAAATTIEAKRSCFSNQGDVAAPGGNGGEDPTDATKPCVPRTGNEAIDPPCTLTERDLCAFGLIGPATTSGTGFGFWSGTSFSSPLVAGLAALAFEQFGNNQQQIYCVILKGASPVTLPESRGAGPDRSVGTGIINVTNTLSEPDVISGC